MSDATFLRECGTQIDTNLMLTRVILGNVLECLVAVALCVGHSQFLYGASETHFTLTSDILVCN